jgi:hypothetical protein
VSFLSYLPVDIQFFLVLISESCLVSQV